MDGSLQGEQAAGFTPRTLDAAEQLGANKTVLATFAMGELQVEIKPGRDTLWVVVRRPGHGGIALKTARSPGAVEISGKSNRAGGDWQVMSSSGRFDVKVRRVSDELLRVTVSLVPAADLLLPFWSRDLYPLGAGDDPRKALGRVEASQRGHNSGLCFFRLDRPKFGNVLYFQNLTALNPYFAATATTPDGVVGGEWPELGYQPPTAPIGNSPPVHPLRKGERVVISDAFLAVRPLGDEGELASARLFVEMMADIYPHLDRPEPGHHDWPARAMRTARDLTKSPEAVIRHYGFDYLHPYVETEYPDSMVQLSVLAALREFEGATGKKLAVADALAAGVGKFFDKERGVLRRYLPNVGDDKDAFAVDSWYLYHPLINLARLAIAGDKAARALLMKSLEYTIRAAHHFEYRWPIQFDVRKFKIITASRNEQGLGQTDVGGVYAYLMLQVHELTGEERYLNEARAALKKLRGARFELVYQTNLTAWGAAACMRLWRMEDQADWLEQAHVFIAGFVHNCALWQSTIGHSRHFTNFFGATCLHDGPYMSAYECFESFAAFDEILRLADRELPAAIRLLLLEYRRYALDRNWFAYPDALPPEAIAQDDIRNGHIDRRLSFPLEDLYSNGHPAGSVGQEIYGCGGAFIFSARAFLTAQGVPLHVFTDYPATLTRTARQEIAIHVSGPAEAASRVIVINKNGKGPERISARLADDTPVQSTRAGGNRMYSVPADGFLRLTWRS